MSLRAKYCVFLLSFFSTLNLYAYHIIGGEIYYSYVSGNTYEITLKLYRDCDAQNAATFDSTAHLAAYDADGNLVKTFSILFPGSTTITPPNNNPCLHYPANVCVEEAVYTKLVTFPDIPAGGLTIVYQRCCRNNSIVNIRTPANEGATYIATIPDTGIAVNNNSAFFNSYPPLVVCAGNPLAVNSSASDPDGDSLVYELVTPFTGADQTSPMPDVPSPPPYYKVNFSPPYSVLNMIGGSPRMAIDVHTGMLTANAGDIGRFIVGIGVKEYRNGKLISENRRDFQFNVVPCDPTVKAIFNASQNTVSLGSDTLVVCGNLKIDFTNTSIGEVSRKWDFGDYSRTSDTSLKKSPSYSFPDTGLYKVMLVINPGSACSDTTYRYLFLENGIKAVFTNPPACENAPVLLTDQSIAYSGIVNSWIWDFGNGKTTKGRTSSNVFSNSGQQKVTLHVTSSRHCRADTTVFITVNPAPKVVAGPDTMVCTGDAVKLFANSNTAVSYTWVSAARLDDKSSPFPTTYPEKTESYVVTVPNKFGCVAKDTVKIKVVDTVLAQVSADTVICVGNSITLTSNEGTYFQWSASNLPIFASASRVIISPVQTSKYYVRSYIGSCFDLDSVNVTVLELPELEVSKAVTINQGEHAFLTAKGAKFYTWSPSGSLSNPDIDNPLAGPINTTTYYVYSESDNGCRTIDSTVVFVTHNHRLFIPSAFSPNGDGINDYFNFYSKGVKSIISVQVFNRYGEVIFQSSGDERGWDGSFNNIPQQTGCYVFFIKAQTFDGDIIMEKGNVTLLR